MKFKRWTVKAVAISWMTTLADEARGLREFLTLAVGEYRGQVDLDALAAHWLAELNLAYTTRYLEWAELACETLTSACRAHGLPTLDVDVDQLRHWLPNWPLREDEPQMARLGRRLKYAVLSQMDGDSFAHCVPFLARVPDSWMTSDLSRSFMPSPSFYTLLTLHMDLEEPDDLLVVSRDAAELEPAKARGHQTLWVGDGEPPAFADVHVADLRALVRLLN